ncbi:MAG: hypothetical protein JWN25_2871, partial [Verrucomicrobiales bacterium]|nr:hypothetical protein [Verrucomicrobiales bacterium]
MISWHSCLKSTQITGHRARQLNMSTSPESEFDLEKLFLPAWATETPANNNNRYAKYTGQEGGGDDRSSGGRRPQRFGNAGGGGRDQRGGPQGDRGNRGPRRDGPGGGGGRPPFRGGPRRDAPPVPQREPAVPLNVEVTIKPDEKGVDSLARQIKVTGRAYPLFDIAQMILQKPERQEVCIEVIKKGENQPVKSLYLCALDESLWLSEDDAVTYVLGKHFNTFYQSEKIPTEPPKGVYTFVAQCGMSGAILGPPNYHDYQNQLRRLHADRFSRIPFDEFKSRVKIVKDEAVVKKWLEDQSFKTEYVALNVPEPLKLISKEDVEKHFRETHLPNMIKAVDSHLLTGAVSREQPSPVIQRLIRQSWEDQKRFPIKV